MVLNLSIPTNYSPMDLKSYDQERHISVGDAYDLLKSQEDPSLSPKKLNDVIDQGDIRVYEFDGNKYLDRLDVGRIYHKIPEERQGLSIERYFSNKGEDPFASVGSYENRHLQITDVDGNIIFDMPDTEFPASWSENAARIVAQKYFFKPKKDDWKNILRKKTGKDYEFSPVHLINRVTSFIVDDGAKLGYFATEEDKEAFADELKWLQIQQRFAFNSPVQFNAGIFNEYGIQGSEGIIYRRNPETGEVRKIEDGEYIFPQCHACFIKGPRDNLESIAEHGIDEIAIFSLGSGIGQDIGALRAEGESLAGGGEASGPISFWSYYDKIAGTIKSGGKSRRAARMTTMRHTHPDSMEFIRCKVGEDRKALILMQNGYGEGMDGEAVKTVSFQNTNISIRIDNDFFENLENGRNVELKRVTDGKVVGEISAERMLKEIAFGSWRVGDPAVQYESLIQEMHTSKNSGRINSSNPCSEYMFLNDTSCNLASLNLMAFADERGNFNVEDFRRAVRNVTIASDILNDAASYPVKDIAAISPEFRTIGVGYANLGALLMRKGIAYDSDEGRNLAAAITSIMTGTTYEASADLAEKLGPFTHFEFNKKPMIEVMEKHRKNLEGVLWQHVPDDLREAAYASWEKVVERGKEVGFRNAQATVLAPTGTISYLMDCDTTGIEPGIALTIFKSLAGGGELTLVNEEVPNALKNLGYGPEQIEEINSFIVENNTVIGAPHMSSEHYNIFATAFGNAKGEGTIPFEGHVRMVAAAQPFISGAISKTNNFPESATVREIYDGYVLGNKIGLKALAVFRNNSKSTSALSFGEKGFRVLRRGEKEDLPERRNAFETEVKIEGVPIHIITSEYSDGRPGQITFLSFKGGSDLGTVLSTSGIQASRALKRGMGLKDVVNGWIGHEFSPQGLVHGHPYIKTATSPLDFAGKLVMLEYIGDTSFAQEPEKVNIKDLRGFESGAFRTYERMEVDPWNIDDVLKDHELGGFVNEEDSITEVLKKNSQNPNKKKQNGKRGNSCPECGNLMKQTNPNCYECERCGDTVGGCG